MSGLYVARPLANESELREWLGMIAEQYPLFAPANLDPDLHVTIVHSAVTIPWQNDDLILDADPLRWGVLGSDRAVVLFLQSGALERRWQQSLDEGAVWGFSSYSPHLTLFYLGAESDVVPTFPALPPFSLILGPERSGPLSQDLFMKEEPFEIITAIDKVDDEKRVVWGWASTSTMKGQVVVDLQGDSIHTDDLMDTAHEFMKSYRTGGHMHREMGIGTVVESMVFTKQLQDALGIDLGHESWLIAIKVDSDEVWKKVKSGELAAFSIGGTAKREEVGKAEDIDDLEDDLELDDVEPGDTDDDELEKNWSDAARAAAAATRKKASEHLQTHPTSNLSLVAHSKGEALHDAAKWELTSRGLNQQGKWVGHAAASQLHGVPLKHVENKDPSPIGEHLQTADNATVAHFASQPKHLLERSARKELTSRGLNSHGSWVGHAAAAEHHAAFSKA